MKTFIFPGQGSQVKGMGGQLFEEFPELTRQASDILGYSIKELCLEDPGRRLNETQFTQPAIYVVSALSYFKRLKDVQGSPDMLAGHSLGEFNALMAAGCFDFRRGLQLVKKRGELLGKVSNGGMAAILNASREKVTAILREHNATGIDIAIQNSPSQCVIAGLKEDLARVEPYFRVGETLYYPLNTSGAFHSRYMQAASDEFESYLATMEFSPLQKPVIANVSARPYRDEELVSNLVRQITQPVRWSESVQYLLAMEGMEFEEIGHGDVLTKLVKTIKAQTPKASTNGAGDRDENLPRSASEKVSSWNATHPIGTKVRSRLIAGKDLETRTAALVLFGHRAAVYLQGYNGYFDLDEIETVQALR